MPSATDMARRRQIVADNGGTYPGPITHGASGYGNYACRCSTCRAGHVTATARARVRRYRRTRQNGGVAPVRQHTTSTYFNWGCRCDTCSAAHSAAGKRYRQNGRVA